MSKAEPVRSMKIIDFSGVERPEDLKDILKSVVENSPQKALGVTEIRSRVKLQDIITELDMTNNPTIILEDAEAATLKEAANTFPWAKANRQLLTFLDAIAGAKEHKVKLAVVPKDEEVAKDAS